MNGLSEEPGQVYSIASRCVCDQCGETPEIQSVTGADPYHIKASCCGKTETKAVMRRDLIHIQRFFAKEGA